MPYIIKNTDGATVATVEDGSVDDSTSLTFVGKNYSGYGQIQNQNLYHLLENFSSSTAPTNPITGQLWFDNSSENRRLNVCYDGKNFKSIANLINQNTDPSLTMAPSDGDLWWDASNKQIKAWVGNLGSWTVVGPTTGVGAVATWTPQSVLATDLKSYPVLTGYIGKDPVVVLSNHEFIPVRESDLYLGFFRGIKSGMNLKTADASGSTQLYSNYFWGTAAESLKSTTSTNITVNPATSGTFYIPFVSTSTGGQPLYTTSTISYDVISQVLNATATSARYADLAERYEADAVYELGTVLIIGGDKEVTVTTTFADTRVVGIVSKNPAYMMNSAAGSDKTHPYIALKGRVPCKVIGYIKKGDLIVTSSTPGYGIAASNVFGGAIIGKALGTQSEGFGVIEVLVV
jgi:hypothetical protein